MNWFFDKDGNVSTFRVSVGVAVLGAIVLIGGYLLFQLELRNAQQPLNVEPPPEASLVAVDDSRFAQGTRYVFYTATVDADTLARYYDQKLAEFQRTSIDDSQRDRCIRTPANGTITGYVAGNGSLPFFWQCLFDNTNIYNQSTLIRIYPGQRNDATGENYEGVTRIDYEQFWLP
jgi:hypothetical protein